MEKLLTIHVHCQESVYVKGATKAIAMIPFTGEAQGPYFNGTVIGTGYDTQTMTPDGRFLLSARYMLEGKDSAGQACKIFIANNGTGLDECRPNIVTDSALLASWETKSLSAQVVPQGDGVVVSIFDCSSQDTPDK